MFRKSFPTILLLLLASLSSACATRVGPGHVGIKVSYAGVYRGVQDVPIVTGWVGYMPGFTTVLNYPTFVQTSRLEGSEAISFNSKEDLAITADISVSYQIQPERVPHFYVMFRSDDLETFTRGFFHNVTRDIFNEVGGKYSVEGIMGPEKAEFLKEVKDKANAFMAKFGVSVVQLGFIGPPQPPPQVMQQLNAKVAATQSAMKAENQIREAKASAQKIIAEAEGFAQSNITRAKGEALAAISRAEGQARANELIARSITPNILTWQRIQLQGKWIEAWGAGGAQIPRVSGGTGQGLLLDLRSLEGQSK